MSEREQGIQNQADWVVTDYANGLMERGYKKIVQHTVGGPEGCHCPNCIKADVSEVNSVIDFYLGDCPQADKLYEAYHYEIAPHQTGISIVQGTNNRKVIFNSETDSGLSTA